MGTKVGQVVKFLGRRFDITAQVVEFQTNSRIEMQVLSGPFPMAWTYTLERIGWGSRLTTRLEADLGGYLRLAGPPLKAVLQRHLDADHATIKALLEDAMAALGQPKGESG